MTFDELELPNNCPGAHEQTTTSSLPLSTTPTNFSLYCSTLLLPQSTHTNTCKYKDAMSEAPRVELNNTDTDFDLSAQTSPFQQTQHKTPQKLQQMNNSSQQANGNNSQNLQNSAIKAKDSILESRVSGTRRLPPCLPRRNLTEYITVLSAARTHAIS
jgi:hypothetical protein